MKNILLLKGASKYNVVRCFVDFLGEGLRKNHCNVEVWDLCHMDDTEVEARIKEWETDVPDAILSFNAIGKESFQQYQDIPFIGWLVDHPIFHHLRLLEWGQKDYAICIDGSHKALIEKYYRNVEGTYFIPHAGIEGKKKIPFSERTIDVLFSGTYTSSNAYLEELQSILQPYEQKIAFILINRMQEQNLTLEQALESFMVENDIPFTEQEFTHLCLRYVYVDCFMRAFFREELIRALTDNGIMIDIYGDNWDQFECNNKEYLRLHEPLDYMDTVEVMCNTKVSLNSIPSFKAGGHERIFTAMLNGALCVTDSNEWLEMQFQDGEEIVYYTNDRIQSVASAIIYYLEDEEEAMRITENAYRMAKEKYTWEVRAKELLSIMDNWEF